jgi:1,5-anhydro-D-fructose reductase (1,5-anhydro-D-mannitol-forming)
MTKPKVRFGIIGFGAFAERALAPAFKSTSNASLVALQKRSLEDARRKAKEHAVPLAFDDPQELVAHPDVDAVFIASANARHCEEAEIAARAGKHVLVEKPMAVNRLESQRMIDSCAGAGVKLMVGHMIRFSPLVQRIRRRVTEGAIGTVIGGRADFVFSAAQSPRTWITNRALAGGGPVFDIGVHCLDTLRYVLDDEIVSVCAELHPRPTSLDTEQSAQIALTFGRGAIGSIFCSFLAPIRRSFIRIIGTTGILSAEDFTTGSRTLELVCRRGKEGKVAEEEIERIEIPNLYVEEITHFSECIQTGTDPLSPGSNGLRNQVVLDAVMESRGQRL